MTSQKNNQPNREKGTLIYEIEGIDFSYPGMKQKVLQGVSLTLKPGEILEILGPNGAGKSTLLNCMAGLLKPDRGIIRLSGTDLREMSPKEIAGQVAYVPQNHIPSFAYRVEDFVLMGVAPEKGAFGQATAEDRERCQKVLAELGIDHLADRSYLDISGGERQQVMIARAMLAEPRAILFDEPTAHLDYGNQYRTLERVRRMADRGFAVVITTHDPNQALLLSGRAAILDRQGHLTAGATEEMITEETLSRIYESDLRLIPVDEVGRTVCVTPNLAKSQARK